MKTADVIIIGGGIIGCATAYYLAKQGIISLVLEKEDIGWGASSRNGGGIRQSARDLRELPLAMDAVKNLWPSLSEELGVDVEYVQKGNLRLGKTEAHKATLEKIVDQGQAAGLDLRMIGPEEIREICPQVSEEVITASYCPTDGHGNPMRSTLAYYKRARELGVSFVTGEEVLSINLIKGKVSGVQTDKAQYWSDQVLLAAGLSSRPLAQTVGLDIPMLSVLTETLVTDQQPPMFPQMIGTAASDFYGHQTTHGSFVFGGMTGLEPFAAEKTNPVSTPITVPHICRAILKYFPTLAQTAVIRTWSGFIDDTADHVPVLSRVDEVPGLTLACGFSGHGYGIAPSVGRLLAQLITDQQPYLSLDAFRYNRFGPKG